MLFTQVLLRAESALRGPWKKRRAGIEQESYLEDYYWRGPGSGFIRLGGLLKNRKNLMLLIKILLARVTKQLDVQALEGSGSS